MKINILNTISTNATLAAAALRESKVGQFCGRRVENLQSAGSSISSAAARGFEGVKGFFARVKTSLGNGLVALRDRIVAVKNTVVSSSTNLFKRIFSKKEAPVPAPVALKGKKTRAPKAPVDPSLMRRSSRLAAKAHKA